MTPSRSVTFHKPKRDEKGRRLWKHRFGRKNSKKKERHGR